MSTETTKDTKRRDTKPSTPNGGDAAITKTALGDEAIGRSGETAMAAVAERARAIVQARIMQALARPRKLSVVRERILDDCDRPGFAAKAIYARPQGQKKIEHEDGRTEWVPNIIEGLSIRFVEAAVQAMGNVEPGYVALYEDDLKKIVRCEVWDYERNISWSAEITIEKSVERSRLRAGQVPIAKRKNSFGDDVYILPATDDEVRLKENRLVSMALRTLGLRIVPSDILEEARERCDATRAKAIEAERAGIAADPTKARRELLDRFAKIGIKAADIVEYFGGRELADVTPDQILELRIVGAGVVSGDLTWRDALAGSPYREVAVATGGEKPEDDKASEARKRIEAKLAETKKAKEKPKADSAPAEPAAAPAATAPPAEPAKREREREPGED